SEAGALVRNARNRCKRLNPGTVPEHSAAVPGAFTRINHERTHMDRRAAIAARWSAGIAFFALGSVLAGCGGGNGGGSDAPAPTASLTANPQTITVGQSAILTWTS